MLIKGLTGETLGWFGVHQDRYRKDLPPDRAFDHFLIADSSCSQRVRRSIGGALFRVRAQDAASEEIAPTASCKSLYSSR